MRSKIRLKLPPMNIVWKKLCLQRLSIYYNLAPPPIPLQLEETSGTKKIRTSLPISHDFSQWPQEESQGEEGVVKLVNKVAGKKSSWKIVEREFIQASKEYQLQELIKLIKYAVHNRTVCWRLFNLKMFVGLILRIVFVVVGYPPWRAKKSSTDWEAEIWTKAAYVQEPEPEFVNVEGAKESIPRNRFRQPMEPGGPSRQITSNRVVVPACQAGNRFQGSIKGLQIRAQESIPRNPIQSSSKARPGKQRERLRFGKWRENK
jgi:hypothetical protein